MEQNLLNIKNEAAALSRGARTLDEIEHIRAKFLGKSGKLTLAIKEIIKLPKEKRKEAGKITNEVKQTIEDLIENKKSELLEKSSVKEFFDYTYPGIKPPLGSIHPISKTIDEIEKIFTDIGFVRRRYLEVEKDWYAFEGLNMPENHPARDDWETFFISKNVVLTPHTTSGQLREMEKVGTPPIRMLNISKCYRRQSDISHSPMFFQFEGLLIDKKISVAHLVGTLDYFAKEFFGKERKTRIRPFHFQFTEPSFEVDVICGNCQGRGCRLCKQGWLELGGAGMVHPVVLKNGGIDPDIYSGLAFGWGVERAYMMKSGIKLPDLRYLYSYDLRILKQL